MNKLVYPTHTCFDDALDFMSDQYPKVGGLYLVHGICQADGKQYSHAWCETDVYAIWSGIKDGKKTYFVWPKEEYYRRFDVVETTKYNFRQAMVQNIKYNNYGPWEQKYLDLCSTSRTIFGVDKYEERRI